MNRNRTKRKIRLLVLTAVCAILLSGVGSCLAADGTREMTTEDLKGKLCGVMEGTIQDTVCRNYVGEDTEFAFFTTTADECVALSKGKIDYVLVVAEIFQSFSDQYPELALVENLSVPTGDTAFVLAEGYDDLKEELNTYIADLEESGELQEMRDYWFSSVEKKTVGLPETGERGVFTVASSCAVQPFDYLQDSEFTGFEAEILAGFGEKYGYGFKLETMNFSSIIAAIKSDKAQIGSNSIFVTEERKKTLIMSESTSSPNFTILMRKEDITSITGQTFEETETVSFRERIKESFYKTFIQENRWKMIAKGLLITLLITFSSAAMGIVLGYWFYRATERGNRFVVWLVKFIKTIMSDTPNVVILMIFYYIIFGKSSLPAVLVAIIAFGLTFASTMSELYHTAISSIDPGQTEAAIALGFKERKGFWLFIAPQGLRILLPLFKGELISLMKGTSVVGYIAITELTKAGDLIRSWTFEPFYPLIVIALIYLLLAWGIRTGLGRLELSLGRRETEAPAQKTKKAVKKGTEGLKQTGTTKAGETKEAEKKEAEGERNE